jgi:hypothetical protein
MSESIQYTLVGLVVLAAVGYLTRRVWRFFQGRAVGRCSGCSACLSYKSTGEPKVVNVTVSKTG